MEKYTHNTSKSLFASYVTTIAVLLTVLGGSSTCIAATATDSIAVEAEKKAVSVETKESERKLTPEERDSILARELNEFVVTGKKNRIEGNKIISVPSQKEKNLSYDPASLIDMMKMPGIRVKDGGINTIDGSPVTIFINGVRANDTDIATFRTEDVVRVEYIHNPADSQYAGEFEVINFIVKEYQAGGLTKASISQTFPNMGFYTLSSKAVYKDMTYSAMVKGSYWRDHFGEEEKTTTYKDIYYNGEHYDEIVDRSHSDLWERDNSIQSMFSARWIGKKGVITHSAGLAWDQNPGSGSRSTEIWVPDILNSTSSNTSTSGMSLSPKIVGDYKFYPSDKFTIAALWSYQYTHNNSSSFYQSSSLDPILNGTKEDVHGARVCATLQYNTNKYIWFMLWNDWNSTWYDTQYSGSNDSHIKQVRGTNVERLIFSWTPNDKFNLYLVPGIRTEYWNFEGEKTQSRCAATAEIFLNWRISSKLRMSASSNYRNYSTKASEASDIILKSSDLLWIKGNSNLKSMDQWTTGIRATWLPSDMFYVGASFTWSRFNNADRAIYTAAPAEMGGLIKTYSNVGGLDDLFASLDLTGRFFKNKLTVNIHPSLDYGKIGGDLKRDKVAFQIDASASYQFGNFNAHVRYRKSTPTLSVFSMTESRNNDQLSISLSWGIKDLYASVGVSNIISKVQSWSNYDSPNYSYNEWGSSWPLQVTVSLSYTISYGKQTNRNIDAGSISTGESGALK
ncbi:MAG: hypothetical protein ACI4AK_08675 [Lepagella sp.]